MAPPSGAHTEAAPAVVAFVLDQLAAAERAGTLEHRALVVGLNGVQGVGKTTLVTALCTALAAKSVPAVAVSIDDFYLTHGAQVALARAHPLNPLWQHRGQPGTHDLALAVETLGALRRQERVRVPGYDKSAFNGQGDRAPADEWAVVNDGLPVRVVIFEGWCVGFKALPGDGVRRKWQRARDEEQQHGQESAAQDTVGVQVAGRTPSRLARLDLEAAEEVNAALEGYASLTDLLDTFVLLAADYSYAYAWREEQEAALRLQGRGGMTPAQVAAFVDGYYPGYELYGDGVRRVFGDEADADKEKGEGGMLPRRQLVLTVDRDRRVINSAVV